MRRVLIGLPVAAAALLSACGDPTPAGNAPATTVPASPSGTPGVPPSLEGGSGSSASPSSGQRPTDLPSGVEPPPAPGRQIVVEGVVEAGVEPGCKILTTPSGSYLLLGSGERIPVGVRVRIRGVAMTAVSTTCQQGTPLRVVSVTRR